MGFEGEQRKQGQQGYDGEQQSGDCPDGKVKPEHFQRAVEKERHQTGNGRYDGQGLK